MPEKIPERAPRRQIARVGTREPSGRENAEQSIIGPLGEEIEKERCDEERRERVQHEEAEGQHAILARALAYRGKDSERNRDEVSEQQRSDGERQGVLELSDERARHGLTAHERHPEVEPDEVRPVFRESGVEEQSI